jgi:hypothetical protein
MINVALFEDVFDITSALKLVTGGRYDQLGLDRQNLAPDGTFDPTSFAETFHATNWRVGAVYRLTYHLPIARPPTHLGPRMQTLAESRSHPRLSRSSPTRRSDVFLDCGILRQSGQHPPVREEAADVMAPGNGAPAAPSALTYNSTARCARHSIAGGRQRHQSQPPACRSPWKLCVASQEPNAGTRCLVWRQNVDAEYTQSIRLVAMNGSPSPLQRRFSSVLILPLGFRCLSICSLIIHGTSASHQYVSEFANESRTLSIGWQQKQRSRM